MSTDYHTSRSVEIPLTKGFATIVDENDADLAKFKWRAHQKSDKRIYATTEHPTKHTIGMHRMILMRMLGRDLLSSEMVDHKNGNCLDNRRSNLRLASNTQNQQNAKKQSRNTSGYKGVRFSKGKWMARISVNGTRLYLGMFDTPQQAHDAYKEAALKYHGEFARME